MKNSKAVYVLNMGVAIILVAIPFTAFFTTWLGANYHHLDLFRIWKEILLIPLGIITLGLLWRDKQLHKRLIKSGLAYLIIGYILLFVISGLVAILRHQVNTNALIYAWLSDLRFIVFFIVCLVASSYSSWLKAHWQKLILIPATAVIIFGLFQHFILPANFLSHFGYGSKTIPAFSTVDQKKQYIRIQSTLRGPNPLGAYLVLIITVLVALALKDKFKKIWLIAGTIAAGVVLFFSYSRSAWMGAALSVCFYLIWQINNRRTKFKLLLVIGALIIILLGLNVGLHRNDRFENILFHTDEHSLSVESSNQSRSQAIRSGIKDITHEPWGRGPGTAGPASYRNNHPTRIAENYFLQIGQEVGIIGIFLFVGICLIVGALLWQSHDEFSLILLASLIGITVINFLSHAWADDTLGLIWWGLAGIAVSGILNTNKRASNENKKTTIKKS